MADKAYDKFSIEAIVEYAQRLEGHTLRESTELEELESPKLRKGSFGNAVEEYYFGYQPNSDPHPDFTEVGLELKTTPLRKIKQHGYSAKERLVLTMIDYNSVVNETFETSHLLEKASQLLLISYEWEKNTSPVDYRVVAADLWMLPPEDMPQFKLDWECVVNKVRAGHAEDISCSDTLYLEACPKAANSSVRRSQPFSDVPAKPRAWALKSSYMTSQQQVLIGRREKLKRFAAEKSLSLQDLIKVRFEPYFGRTEDELALLFGVGVSKQRAALITKHILGVSEDATIDEFVKADIHPKTVHLRANGRLKESVTFPAFDYFDVLETSFEDSDFYQYLQRKWLFVVYRPNSAGIMVLAQVVLWQMPESDYPEATRCYETMQELIRTGHAEVSPKASQNRCCHVRPHARNAADTVPQPFGDPVVKKSFWLNATYVSDELAKYMG